jgi:hypothetical protein
VDNKKVLPHAVPPLVSVHTSRQRAVHDARLFGVLAVLVLAPASCRLETTVAPGVRAGINSPNIGQRCRIFGWSPQLAGVDSL